VTWRFGKSSVKYKQIQANGRCAWNYTSGAG
jgi:hypothetical protein